MHSLESHIAQSWKNIQPSIIYIGASGGLDSTVLAFVLKKLNFNVEVLHVNYQLRGEDSEKDALFLASFCKSHSIPFHQKTINLSAQLQSGGNLQELARNVRYNWFNEFLSENETSFLALAHHQNDQVETFFLNLSRKSGVMGLAGMLEKNNRFIRPFLTFSKKDIESYALENKISWREDKSNSSNKYRRNFLRNEILPILQSKIPNIEESVLILVEQFQKKQLELENRILPIKNAIIDEKTFPISDFLALSELEKNELLRQFGQSSAKVEELIHLVELQNGKRIRLAENRFDFTEIVKQDKTFYFLKESKMEVYRKLIIASVDSLPTTFSKNEIYLDASKIKGELVLRKWKIGDRIKPIGMNGSKLVSDVIKDAKLSPFQKQETLVVTDDENVHWVVGLVVGRGGVASDSSIELIKCYVKTPPPIVTE